MIDWLFDSSEFMTRSNCGTGWTPWLIFWYKISNMIIALAYFSIPLTLMWMYIKRRHFLPKSWIYICFSLFIFFCGITHVLDVVVFHWPPYRLVTLISWLTAALSIGTACVLPGVMRHLAKLPSPEEHYTIQEQLMKEMGKKNLAYEALKKKNRILAEEKELLKSELSKLEYRIITKKEQNQILTLLEQIRRQ